MGRLPDKGRIGMHPVSKAVPEVSVFKKKKGCPRSSTSAVQAKDVKMQRQNHENETSWTKTK
eukprot:1477010-Amphidinium_carterae.2